LALGTLSLLALAGGAAGLGWAALRPNRADVDRDIVRESWPAVADGRHNSNTDLISWRGAFWLVHAASPWHLGSPDCRLRLWRSEDARRFEPVTEFRSEGEDIRDPKLAAIGDRLFLYALPNHGRMALPYTTVFATSEDGSRWSALQPVRTGEEGWLFWRPKTRDGATWYVPAYWHRHGRSALFSSWDGERWSLVSEIHRGDANDETDMEFLPDGRMLATCRLEGRADSPLGSSDACTLLATAAPPYTHWSKHRSDVTRLDGPALFRYRDRVLCVARHQPGRRGPLTRLGGMLSRKRTSLFAVEPERLVHLTDLPSAGDTSYAGVVVQDRELLASYYTSDVTRDYPWGLGMFLPSDIRMARLDLDAALR